MRQPPCYPDVCDVHAIIPWAHSPSCGMEAYVKLTEHPVGWRNPDSSKYAMGGAR